MLSVLSSWATTISLIFGGCCSNAITLEQLTLEYPNAGSVLTLLQFLLISLHGLPKFVVWTRFGPRFRPRRVPMTSYLTQVVLFYLISLLNNAAFAYRIPMVVHIIFRSGGLIITCSLVGILCLLVTIGVVITTLSAQSSSTKSTSVADPYTYATGIGILTLALILSGMLVWPAFLIFCQFLDTRGPAPWQESMFYLHFLALPMFLPLLPDLATQMHSLNITGPRAELSIPIPVLSAKNLTTTFPMGISLLIPCPIYRSTSFACNNATAMSFVDYPLQLSLSIPHIYLPLSLNAITQIVCVAGVNRLTTRVSALTVTLVLVVRKAVSLIISVIGVSQVGLALRALVFLGLKKAAGALGLGVPVDEEWSFNVFGIDVDALLSLLGTAFVGTGKAKRPQEVDNRMMWTGAAMVLLGTIGYTIGSSRSSEAKPEIKKNKME
ncbi:UAA transporter family-domain-containing protein [Flammula alnicola]|nr:UAA transporter family-domain-containing protein [Flammula alnicola]